MGALAEGQEVVSVALMGKKRKAPTRREREKQVAAEFDQATVQSTEAHVLESRPDDALFVVDQAGDAARRKRAYELMKEFDKFRNNVMKEFDKFRNNVESMADDYCVINRKMCVVSADMEGLGTKICGVHEVVDVLQRNQGKFLEKIKVFSDDLAELDTFFDNVASKFNLHGVPLPKVRGKRKITIIR